jgi:hypothetical protein
MAWRWLWNARVEVNSGARGQTGGQTGGANRRQTGGKQEANRTSTYRSVYLAELITVAAVHQGLYVGSADAFDGVLKARFSTLVRP